MEDFITYELAVKLKEKGFRKPCILYYNSDKVRTWFNEPDIAKNFIPTTLGNDDVLAPTISQVLKWLRDKFFLHISQKPYSCEDGLMWMYEIRKFNKYIIFVIANKTGFVKEEQATLAGIEYVLDNLI